MKMKKSSYWGNEFIYGFDEKSLLVFCWVFIAFGKFADSVARGFHKMVAFYKIESHIVQLSCKLVRTVNMKRLRNLFAVNDEDQASVMGKKSQARKTPKSSSTMTRSKANELSSGFSSSTEVPINLITVSRPSPVASQDSFSINTNPSVSTRPSFIIYSTLLGGIYVQTGFHLHLLVPKRSRDRSGECVKC